MAKRRNRPVQSFARSSVIISLVIAALSNFALYQQALFNGGLPQFDAPILLAGILSLALGLVFCFHYIRLKEKPAVWPLLLIWLIPLTVVLSSFGAVSRHGAFMAILIHVVYALLFTFGYVVIRSEQYRRYAVLVVHLSGYAVVLFGLVNWFGLKLYKDAVNMFSGEYRLMSVFQYANTYGAFLIALTLSSLFIVTYARSRVLRFVSAAMLPLLLISLILTLSRGAWLAFPVLFVFFLLFLRPSRQVLYMLYTLAAGIPALAVFSPVNRLGIGQQEAFAFGRFALGVGLLIAASAATAILGHLISRYVEPRLDKWARLDAKRTHSMWLPLGSIAIVAGLGTLLFKTSLVAWLPDNIEQRVSSINFAQHSVLERFSFYADALRISRDYPVFGAGGGAWNVLYEQYQSYPYQSSQVHSFFLQHLVETGWTGLLVLVVIFAWILIQYMIRSLRSGLDESSFLFFILVVSLLVHSLIDFNFSYVVIGAIVYFSLGLLAQDLPRWSLSHEQTVTRAYSVVLPLLLLFVLFVSIRTYDGHLAYNKTNQLIAGGQPSAHELLAAANRAVQQSKQFAHLQNYFSIEQLLYNQFNDPAYLSGMSQAVELMEKYEPERRDTFFSRYVLYLLEGKTDEAVRHLISGTEKYPWDLPIYTEAFYRLYEMGSQDQPSYWDEVLALFAKMENKMAQIAKLPPYQVQTKPFEITKEIAGIVGKIQCLKQEYASAYDTIVRYLDPQPPFGKNDTGAIKQFFNL